ncbi:MAG: two-component system, NarL family, sensor histidine kinase BarA [Candidatus Binatota bacterium]|nr:two-component system, NarL family, sensor histidine kinase BarA [Candidatus Binatota bacterium]
MAAYSFVSDPTPNSLIAWNQAEIDLLREIASSLTPFSAEIAQEWAGQLIARIGAPLSNTPYFQQQVLEANHWFLEGHLLNLQQGNLSRVFQHNMDGDRALLRSQRVLDPEVRSTLSHLYLSFDLSTGAIVRRLRQIYRDDPRLPEILEVYGRVSLLLGEGIGLAFHEVTSEDLRQALRTSASLLEAARELNTRSGSLAAVLEKLCRIVRQLVRSDKSIVFLWSEAGQQYSPQAVAGFSEEQTADLRALRIRREDFPLMEAILDGKIVSGSRDDGTVPRELMERFGESVYAVAPMLDPDGRPLGALAAYRSNDVPFGRGDVEILEGIARNAALAVENAMLVEGLESAARRKSDFINSMSHELRTPLNALIGYLDMLFDVYQGDQSGLEMMRRMRRSGNYLLKLVNNILDLERIEAGEMPLRDEPVEVTEIFRGLDEMFATVAHDRGITFSCTTERPDLAVVTDRMKVQEILNNLVANALKYTDRGGAVAVRAASDGGKVVFRVSDTGIGIEETDLDRIFEMFRQVGDGGRGGAGLGLNIVKRFTDLLGGKLEVESAVGKGSTFRIALPARNGGPRPLA